MEDEDLFIDESQSGEDVDSPPAVSSRDMIPPAYDGLDAFGRIREGVFGASRAEREEMIQAARDSVRELQRRGKGAVRRVLQDERERRRRVVAEQLCHGDMEEADRIIAAGGPHFRQRMQMLRWRMTHPRRRRK